MFLGNSGPLCLRGPGSLKRLNGAYMPMAAYAPLVENRGVLFPSQTWA